MKKLKYLTIPATLIYNALILIFISKSRSFLRVDYHNPKGFFMSAPVYIFLVIAGAVLGVALSVTTLKILIRSFEKIKQKPFAVAISLFAVAVAVGIGYLSFFLNSYWVFLLATELLFAALYCLIGALYVLLTPWINSRKTATTAFLISFGVLLSISSIFVFLADLNLINTPQSSLKGIYSANIAISALLFIFGAAALVSVFVKGSRFSWVRPAATVLLVVLICFSVITVLLTGLTSGTGNFIKNAAIDVGMVRLGLTDDDFVCAYEGGDGERIYLLKTGRTDSDAELSELLECTKLGDVYQRTVNGVEYKHICLDDFGGYYIFTIIPA